MESPKFCPHCGAKMVKYKHSLSIPMVEGLTLLRDAGGGPINIKELNMSRNQWDNFQKLRYFKLVKRVYEDGVRKSGVWKITKRGRRFLLGDVMVPRAVWTYRGKTCDKEPERIFAWEVSGFYQDRETWWEQARPKEEA